MQKPKLYLDFDGVIGNSIEAITTLYNDDFQAYSDFHPIMPEDIHTWNFLECKCAPSEIFSVYFNTPRFYRNLKFMDLADVMIWLLSYQFNLTIVSFGNPANLKLKQKWIDDNLKTYINGTNMVNQAETKFIGLEFSKFEDKSCVDMSDGIFVDDTYDYLVSSNAKHKIVFGNEYPWNSDNEINNDTGMEEHYTRCKDWLELYQKIMSIYNRNAIKGDMSL